MTFIGRGESPMACLIGFARWFGCAPDGGPHWLRSDGGWRASLASPGGLTAPRWRGCAPMAGLCPDGGWRASLASLRWRASLASPRWRMAGLIGFARWFGCAPMAGLIGFAPMAGLIRFAPMAGLIGLVGWRAPLPPRWRSRRSRGAGGVSHPEAALLGSGRTGHMSTKPCCLVVWIGRP